MRKTWFAWRLKRIEKKICRTYNIADWVKLELKASDLHAKIFEQKARQWKL